MVSVKSDVVQDEYFCVLNRPETYQGLAITLGMEPREAVVFAWTDEAGTQLDILMAYRPMQFGMLQRGMKARTDLFVAVSTFGMFGFEMNDIEKYPGYVGEKLGLGGTVNETTIKLAELINGVIKELA